jgi:hypothetical protein
MARKRIAELSHILVVTSGDLGYDNQHEQQMPNCLPYTSACMCSNSVPCSLSRTEPHRTRGRDRHYAECFQCLATGRRSPDSATACGNGADVCHMLAVFYAQHGVRPTPI